VGTPIVLDASAAMPPLVADPGPVLPQFQQFSCHIEKQDAYARTSEPILLDAESLLFAVSTHRAGNAVVRAAGEARKAMLEVAGELLEASPDDLETDGKGNIHVKGVAEKSITVGEVAGAAHFAHGKAIAGRGAFLKPASDMDPETGAIEHHCMICDHRQVFHWKRYPRIEHIGEDEDF